MMKETNALGRTVSTIAATLLCLQACAVTVWLTLEMEHGEVTFTPPPDGEVIRQGNTWRVPFERGREVDIFMQSEGDWLFEQWTGEVMGEQRLNPAHVVMDEDRSVAARFLERPGVSKLDLVKDFRVFLKAIGETSPVEEFDKNEVTYGEDAERVYVGNGMPDVAELYLLQAVLKIANLTLTRHAGVAHTQTWEAWEHNLARVMQDLPNQDESVQRVIAGYMTLGEFESRVFAEHVAEMNLGYQIDPANYENYGARFYPPDEDTDSDLVPNMLEWEIACPNASLGCLQEFAANALDHEQPDSISAEKLAELKRAWRDKWRNRRR